MPLNSVQLHIRNLLDGLVIPGGIPALQAYITPPVVEELGDQPKAYVWGGRVVGRRSTAPRGAGFKRLDWMVDVYLSYETAPDMADVDQEFPLIVDAVLARAWTTTMPTMITDPTTGLVSQLLSIGEDFNVEYPPEKTPATLRLLYYTARIGLSVREDVNL